MADFDSPGKEALDLYFRWKPNNHQEKLLDKVFWKEVHQYQEKQTMPFLTTPERIAKKDTILELMLIGNLLQAKFGEQGAKLMPTIADLDDIDKYNTMIIAIAKVTNLEEVRRACAAALAPPEPKKKNSRRKRG